MIRLDPKAPNAAPLRGIYDVHPAKRRRGATQPDPSFGERQGRDGGTAAPLWRGQRAHALWAVRQFFGLDAGSSRMALSRPGRAPGWCPIPPTSTPAEYAGAYPTREEHPRGQ
ncbi:MAG TPA: hypothetical protein VK897_13040 [Anaerolineales bacterium]|nr:hypothetical protein [Anaerolineales bacterium]